MSNGNHVERFFGYAFEHENRDQINEMGVEPDLVLQLARASYPAFNPHAPAWTNLQWQGRQGACQGHALAHAFQVAMVMRYSDHILFSRADAYYSSQKFDGITNDRGSTLNGGQKVAARGLCLEKDWPYPERYDNRMPDSAGGKQNFQMPGSKEIRDADLAWDLLKAGVMIQTGVAWTDSFEREISDSYSRSGNVGGHSTLLFGIDEEDRAIHHNSWKSWMQDGRSKWTKNYFAQIIRNDRWAVFVAYDSTSLIVPPDYHTRINQ